MNTPKEIANNYMAIGQSKAAASFSTTFLLAVMAGAFIAFGGVASTFAGVAVPSAAKLVGAAVFPGGLAMVLLAGSELFTGNCLLVLPALSKKITVFAMLRNWLIVYAGNFVGALAVAALVVFGHSLGVMDGLAMAAMNTAAAKCSLSFGDAVMRGILCNFLVCVAVWISFAAKSVSGKIAGIFFPIMMFVLCGFEHSVANMYFIGTGLFASALPEYAALSSSAITWSNFFLANLLPVTIGNIIGGAVVVGGIYWKVYAPKN